MFDCKGREIQSGDYVRITGAYFKNDNGDYIVHCSPGDEGWTGLYHSLIKTNKNKTEKKGKYRLGSWPIMVFTNSRELRNKTTEYNLKHATIEIIEKGKGYYEDKTV